MSLVPGIEQKTFPHAARKDKRTACGEKAFTAGGSLA
jgi:hypothetical protein